MADIYGALIARGDVEHAALKVLSTPPDGSTYPLLAYYLAERERQQHLKPRTLPLPPASDSYRGGLDFNAYAQDLCPMVIAVAQVIGPPERKEDARYGQWFSLQVGVIVVAADEDSTRALADEYGIALTAAIAQNGSLGKFATSTNLTGYPVTEFLDPTKRRLMRSVATFETYVEGVVGERQGPQDYGRDPYAIPPGLPTVASVGVTLGIKT